MSQNICYMQFAPNLIQLGPRVHWLKGVKELKTLKLWLFNPLVRITIWFHFYPLTILKLGSKLASAFIFHSQLFSLVHFVVKPPLFEVSTCVPGEMWNCPEKCWVKRGKAPGRKSRPFLLVTGCCTVPCTQSVRGYPFTPLSPAAPGMHTGGTSRLYSDQDTRSWLESPTDPRLCSQS